MLSRNHDGRDRTHWLDERGQPACWNAHQECAEHKVAVLTAANTALSERLAAVTAALVKQQDVEDHTLECLPCLHSDDCRIKDRLTADANVARADILAAGQPAPAAAEGS